MEYSDRIQALASFLLKNSLYDEYNYLCKFASDEPTDDDIVAATLVKEASVDGEEGMKAVHQVIMNRAGNASMTKKAVVLEKGDDGVYQFSCWNGIGEKARKAVVDKERATVSYVENKKKVKKFDIALRIVEGKEGNSDVGASTHYYTDDVPDWATDPEDCVYNTQGDMTTKRELSKFPESAKINIKTPDGSVVSKNILGYCRKGNPCWKFIANVGSHTFGIDYSSSKYLRDGVDQCYKDRHNEAERGYGIYRWPRYRNED